MTTFRNLGLNDDILEVIVSSFTDIKDLITIDNFWVTMSKSEQHKRVTTHYMWKPLMLKNAKFVESLSISAFPKSATDKVGYCCEAISDYFNQTFSHEKWDYYLRIFASFGFLNGCIWARDNGSIVNYVTCECAATTGQFDIIRWAREQGAHWNSSICAEAARSGMLDVLKWAHQNGCPWDTWTCSNAALNGHLDILMWARDNGCPWDKMTCLNATLNGHFEVFIWAREKGCPCDKSTCSYIAMHGNLDVLIWAIDKDCPWDETTLVFAAKHGHLNLLKWFYENNHTVNTQSVRAAAEENAQFKIVNWLSSLT